MANVSLTKGQEILISEIEDDTQEGTYEIEVVFSDSGIQSSLAVSECSEDDIEPEDVNDDVVYFELSVRSSVELCISQDEHDMGFKIVSVNGVTRTEILEE
ncbi:hypothetical protein VCHA53O466_140170 [Vibrio chagasii]|nr:hypothetical protein VCHA53O466_140170 [Vibrio chagasii]